MGNALVSAAGQQQLLVLNCEQCGGVLRIRPDKALPTCEQCGAQPALRPTGDEHGEDLLNTKFRDWASRRQLNDSGTENFRCRECGASFTKLHGDRVSTCEYCGSTHIRLKAREVGFIRPDGMILPKLTPEQASNELIKFMDTQTGFYSWITKFGDEWMVGGIRLEPAHFRPESLHGVFLAAYEYHLRVRVQVYAKHETPRDALADMLRDARVPAFYEAGGFVGNATKLVLVEEFIDMLEAPLLADATRSEWNPTLAPDFQPHPIVNPPRKAWNQWAKRNKHTLLTRHAELLKERSPLLWPSDFELVVHDIHFKSVMIPFYVVMVRSQHGVLRFMVDAVTGSCGAFPESSHLAGYMSGVPTKAAAALRYHTAPDLGCSFVPIGVLMTTFAAVVAGALAYEISRVNGYHYPDVPGMVALLVLIVGGAITYCINRSFSRRPIRGRLPPPDDRKRPLRP